MNAVATLLRRTTSPASAARTVLGVVAWAAASLGAARALYADAVLSAGAIPVSDLIAPIDVQVTPAVTNERVVTRDGHLLPAVVRLDTGAAETALREFDEAFRHARSEFTRELAAAFGETAISEEKISSLRFQSFRSEFVAAHPEFPVGYVLAAAWARGDDGEVVRARMSSVVAQIVVRQLIGRVPDAATVFVLTLPRSTVVRSWSEASPAMARAVDRSGVLTLEQARAELWRSLGVGERFAGGFLETLIRENVSYDARLTGLFLHERLGAQLPGRFFGRGETLAKAGEPVDALAAEAMQQIDALGLAPLTPMPAAAAAAPANVAAVDAGRAPAPAVATLAESVPTGEPAPSAPVAVLPMRWIYAVGVAGLVSFVLGLWGFTRLVKLRRATHLASVAPPAEPSLREALAPHLAREMTERGMQALFSQRQELLENASAATERVAEMETRVAKVQPAIQERMQSYERRIKALERELQER